MDIIKNVVVWLVFALGIVLVLLASDDNNILSVGIIFFLSGAFILYDYISDRNADKKSVVRSDELTKWLGLVMSQSEKESQDKDIVDRFEHVEHIDYVDDLLIRNDDSSIQNNEEGAKLSLRSILLKISNKQPCPYERSILSYLIALLSSQQSLLVRNRAYFFTLSVALAGFGIKELLESPDVSSPADKMITMLLIAFAGIFSNYFWKITTYRRGYKVWFIETLLLYLENNKTVYDIRFGPMELLIYCENRHFDAILQSSKHGIKVMNCVVRKTFKKLRLIFAASFWLSFLVSAYYASRVFACS